MRKTFIKLIIPVFIIFSALSINMTDITYGAAVQAPVKPQTVYTTAFPIDVVNHPSKYLNKNITFEAEFVAFSSLGLDYKPAFKDGSKYIAILIKRDDVKDHVIPLSEMKIFVTRELAEKNVDVEAGDKIKLSGKIFSDALGDPWMDASEFKILTHKEKPKETN